MTLRYQTFASPTTTRMRWRSVQSCLLPKAFCRRSEAFLALRSPLALLARLGVLMRVVPTKALSSPRHLRLGRRFGRVRQSSM